MKTTYSEIINLNAGINKLTTKGLQHETVMQLLDMKEELNHHSQKYQDKFKAIMGEHGVKESKGMYDWSESEHAEAITEKIQSLFAEEVKLKKSNFLTEKEALTVLEGLTVGEIVYFRNYLK